MMTFWMKTVNTEKAYESHISEILETLEKAGMIGGYLLYLKTTGQV